MCFQLCNNNNGALLKVTPLNLSVLPSFPQLVAFLHSALVHSICIYIYSHNVFKFLPLDLFDIWHAIAVIGLSLGDTNLSLTPQATSSNVVKTLVARLDEDICWSVSVVLIKWLALL